MRRPHQRTHDRGPRIFVATFLSVFALVAVSAAQPAPSGSTHVIPGFGAPVTARLQSGQPGADSRTPIQPDAFQSSCYGQTDRPHLSSHVPGTVNVIARTVCPGESVYVETALYRDRWYGLQFLDSGSKSAFGSVSTNAAWNCSGTGTYAYRAYSYHKAAISGHAYTSNSARFTC